MRQRLTLVIVAAIAVGAGIAIGVSATTPARTSLSRELEQMQMARDDARDESDFLRLEWQRQLLGLRAAEAQRPVAPGVYLARLVEGDRKRVTVDWLSFNGTSVGNHSDFVETLAMAPLSTVSVQGETSITTNEVSTSPEPVDSDSWDAILRDIARGPAAYNRWWVNVDEQGFVRQMVQAAGTR